MIYLDYSATTPIEDSVLETYINVSKNFIGNANSIHSLGIKSKELLNSSTNQIASLLNIKPTEIIYTSGATESNNLALKGIAFNYKNRGKHIISTPLEHSSVSETLKYLESIGYKISYVKVLDNGLIDIENLKSLITDETILVSIGYINSELGIRQNIEEISNILENYPKTFFHVDGTQAIGKINVDLNNIDLFSFSSHKIYGPKGIGCLIKKDKISLIPLMHGGKSESPFRSGTPSLPLIVSLAKALRLSLENINQKYEIVNNLNNKIKENLKKYNKIMINSNENCIPHILNISLSDIRPETFIHAMEEHEIYISTKSACSNPNVPSTTLKAMNKDDSVSTTSIRISISNKTTLEEIEKFNEIFDQVYNDLNSIKGE
ncbi:MAG: cysteine desulfurase [Bacilli bacterium]|nr:cysteine desulfurase [Bacilli bacterium]